MTYPDAVARISEIQQQIASLRTAFVPPAARPASVAPSSGSAAVSGSPTTFASALAQAQTGASEPDDSGGTGVATVPGTPIQPSSGGGPLSSVAQGMLPSGQQQVPSRL